MSVRCAIEILPNIAAMDKLGDVADFVSCANKICNVPLKKVLSAKARGRTPNANCFRRLRRQYMFGGVGAKKIYFE